MRYISFHLLYSLIWLLTRLPLSWLYCISNLLYYLVFYLFPYRKKLVLQNMQNAFPEWDHQKVVATAKKFYRFFCDMIIESAYCPFMSEKELNKRFIYKNTEVINEIYNKGKSVILVLGHYGNWEWGCGVQNHLKHQAISIYKPLQNKYFDKLIISSRERFGGKTVPMESTLRYLMEASRNNKLTLSYFLADQRPLKKNILYWINFLNQDTPIYNGPEKIAGKLDMAVVYKLIQRKKRGYYEVTYIPITENPNELEELEIMKRYFTILEKNIQENPEYWLWTHNRWKYKREEFN